MKKTKWFESAHKMTQEAVLKWENINYAVTFAESLKIVYKIGAEIMSNYSNLLNIKMDEIYLADDRQPNKEVGVKGGFNLSLSREDGHQKRKAVEILIMKDGRFQVKITPTCAAGKIKIISRKGKSNDFTSAEIEAFSLIKEIALEYLSRYDSSYAIDGYLYSCGGKFEI